MSSVTDRMLSRFVVVYGEPRTGDLEAFFAEYEKAMRGTRDDIIDKATDEILKTHERRSWPTIGECRKAIDAVAAAIQARNAAKAMPEPAFGRTPVSPDQRASVRALVADFKATVAKHNDVSEPKSSVRRVDRDAWNARKVVGVSRHGDPIRKDGN